MFDSYSALCYTLISARVLHISIDDCYNHVVYMGCHTPHLLVCVLALAHITHRHNNIGPDPTMS